MLLRVLFIAAIVSFAQSLICDDCLIYNGQQCVQFGSCQGGACLYEYAQQSNGQTMMKKSCVAQNAVVIFDDGTELTTKNQCVTKTTAAKSYVVKLCTTGDYCNRVCENPQPLPVGPPAGNRVTCYSCSAMNGQDCNSGVCNGAFCTYSQQRQQNGAIRVTKGCSETPQILLDDNTPFNQINTCETRMSAMGSTYSVQLCTSNYCNAYCTPNGGPDPTNPQRQPLVTCYSCELNNAYECTGNTCQGNYCMYERQTPQNGVPFVRRSCSLTNMAIYPDQTTTTTTNQCERKTVNGVSYAFEFCNTGSYCDTQCNSVSSLSSILSLLLLPVIYLFSH